MASNHLMINSRELSSSLPTGKGSSSLRLLVISPSFAPQADSEAFCGAKWVLALQEAGADVVVLADHNHGEARAIDPSPAWASLRSVTLSISTPQERNLVRSAFCAFRYQTWAWARWIGRVVSTAKLLHNQNSFDLVVARSVPWDACMAAFWVSKTIRRPWVANMNDPWDISGFASEPGATLNATYQLLMKVWLRRSLQSATRVTYPCQRLAGHFARIGSASHASSVIPHIGWKRQRSCSSREFRLVHAGKLGTNEVTGKRSSLPLLRGLALFLDRNQSAKSYCRLIFVGPEDQGTTKAIQGLNLRNHVENVGWVAYEESLHYISGATVCVLVEGLFEEGIFLPSKLADYLVARKPVLALSPRVGTVSDLAAERGIYRVDLNDIGGVAAQLEFLYERFRRGELTACEPTESLAGEFEAKSVAMRSLDLIQEVIDRRANAPNPLSIRKRNLTSHLA